MKLETLKELLSAATPGPYKNDSGNGEIESEHPEHRRIVICQRADLSERYADYRRLGNLLPHADVEWDMVLIAAALNALPELIAVVENAPQGCICHVAIYDGYQGGTKHTDRCERYMAALEELEKET